MQTIIFYYMMNEHNWQQLVNFETKEDRQWTAVFVFAHHFLTHVCTFSIFHAVHSPRPLVSHFI